MTRRPDLARPDVSATLPFTKMHGAGNDFVCLDAVADPTLEERDDLPSLAAAMSDRSSGVCGPGRSGADGLIVIGRAGEGRPRADVRMRMFNTDGSESAMCGNGLRCVARYAAEHGLVSARAGRLAIETAGGVREALLHRDPRTGEVDAVTIDMGPPVLDLPRVPVDGRRVGGAGPEHEIEVEGAPVRAVFVSMGNPHAVIYVPSVAAVDVADLGPHIETHPAFPQRMNVHFVGVLGPAEVRMRSWERGCGETGACGSGACAVCVAGVLTGRTARALLAHLPGGDLEPRWDEGGSVFLTGPAVEEFSGRWPDPRDEAPPQRAPSRSAG